MFSSFISLLVLSLVLYSSVTSKNFFLAWIAFSCSYWGATFHAFGIPMNLAQMVSFVGFVYVLFHLENLRIQKRYWVLFFGVIVLSVLPLAVGYGYSHDIPDYGYAFLQSPRYRSFIQLGQRLSYYSLFLLPFLVRSENRKKILLLVLQGYILGTTTQCILGIYQIVATKIGLPVWQYTFGAEMVVGGFVRMNAFAGEPRHFAMFLLPSLLFLLFNLTFFKLRIFTIKAQVVIVFLHIIGLVMSQSTSGFGLFFFTLLVGIFFLGQSKYILKSILAMLIIGIVASSYLALAGQDVVQTRIINRVSFEFYKHSEYSTFSAVELLSKEPIFLFTGLGVGFPAYYLKEMPTYQLAYSRNSKLNWNTLRDPSGLVLILLESGIWGVIFIVLLLAWLFKCARMGHDNLERLAAFFVVVIYLCGFITYGPLSPQFSLTLGALLAAYDSQMTKVKAYAFTR